MVASCMIVDKGEERKMLLDGVTGSFACFLSPS